MAPSMQVCVLPLAPSPLSHQQRERQGRPQAWAPSLTPWHLLPTGKGLSLHPVLPLTTMPGQVGQDGERLDGRASLGSVSQRSKGTALWGMAQPRPYFPCQPAHVGSTCLPPPHGFNTLPPWQEHCSFNTGPEYLSSMHPSGVPTEISPPLGSPLRLSPSSALSLHPAPCCGTSVVTCLISPRPH